MTQEQRDVVIVGAGVAGLYAAYRLAKEGLNVLVIEKNPEELLGEKVCGDAIGKHHFDMLELDYPEIGFDAEGVFRGVKVVSPDEQRFIEVLGDGYALNRRNFGLRLYRLALSKGAEVWTSHRFHKPLIEGTKVVGIEALRDDGSRVSIRAKVTIDASGVAAVVRRSLPSSWWVSEPIPMEDLNVTYREVWEGDIDIDHDFAWIYLNVDVAPGGYWWLFPKRRGLYNVGLGVQAGRGNPRIQFLRHVKKRFEKNIARVVHAGGGLVPTRRPIPCMVWNGLVVVGDAASTANPVHGGGIGSAMLSSKIAAKVITEALEKHSEATIEALWRYHIEFHRAYGAKQASLDVLRMFLQTMSNDGLNFVFRSGLVDGSEVYDIGAKGVLRQSIFSKLGAIIRLSRKPAFLAKLAKVKSYMDRARELYLSYPDTPSKYEEWRSKERQLFNEYKEWLLREA
ncbi:MAG: NAD(P)/FAD-dependent oxidoreductase [Crenarchaeota archaeon]|nr:NAD(P)/FAD-dependent oxidoreductase [Thermoproteota archaeon]